MDHHIFRMDRKRSSNSKGFYLFIWGVRPEALYHLTRAEYKIEPGSIKTKDLLRLYTEHYLPKRKTYHNRGDFLLAKQSEDETLEAFWRRLIEIGKECNFNTSSVEYLMMPKYMNAVIDKQLRGKMMKENPRNEENDSIDQTKDL